MQRYYTPARDWRLYGIQRLIWAAEREHRWLHGPRFPA